MPTLAKKNLPESMAKSTLPEVLTLKLPEDGKSISVLPVALLGRDSDGCGVLVFGDSDGTYSIKKKITTTEETVEASSEKTADGDSSATPIDVSEYREGTFFLHVAAGGSDSTVVSIISQDPTSGEWAEIGAFSTITGSEAIDESLIIAAGLGSSVAAKWVVPTGSYTFSVGAVFKTY